MAHKIIVRTEKGRRDSLRQSVEIVFTLTPTPVNGRSIAYDPVAQGHMSFAIDSEQREAFEWRQEYAFDRYERQTDEGNDTCANAYNFGEIQPGESRTMVPMLNTIDYPSHVFWDPTQPSKGRHLSQRPALTVLNQSGATQNVALQVKHFASHFKSIAAYYPLENGESLTTSSELALQAYVFSELHDGDILRPEHLTHPLFPTPISCNALPATSTWRLSQDHDGTILLKDDELAIPRAIDILAESFDDMKAQLTEVVKSLNDTRRRLDLVELSAAGNEAEICEAQQSIMATQIQVDRLDSRILVAEGKALTFGESLGQVQEDVSTVKESFADQLFVVETSLEDTQQRLADVNATVTTNREVLFDLNDRRIPAMEAATERLGLSFDRTQDQISTVRKSVTATRDQLFTLDRSVLTVVAKADQLTGSLKHNEERLSVLEKVARKPGSWVERSSKDGGGQTPEPTPRRGAVKSNTPDLAVPALQAPKPLAIGEAIRDDSIGDPQQTTANHIDRIPSPKTSAGVLADSQLSAKGKTSEQVRFVSAVRESLRALKHQVTALERRLPAVELKTEKLAKGFGQTMDNLTAMHESTDVTRRQVARLELKVPAVEAKAEQLADYLLAATDQLVGLDSRVNAVETKVGYLAESGGSCPGPGVGRWLPSSPSLNDTSTFPSGLFDSIIPYMESVAREPLPELSLSQPVESD